jgi:hypothetical protein
MFGNCMQIVVIAKALDNPKGAIRIDSDPGVYDIKGGNQKNSAFF